MNSVPGGPHLPHPPAGPLWTLLPPQGQHPSPPGSQRPSPKAPGSNKEEGNPEVKAQLTGSLPSSAQRQWDGATSPTTTWSKTRNPKKVKPRGTALVPGAQLPAPLLLKKDRSPD